MWQRELTRSAGRLFCVCLLMMSGGCVTASLATLGSVLGTVGSAASTGSDVYKLGKLEAALNADAFVCHTALLESARDLKLRVQVDQRTMDETVTYETTLIDELNTPVGIRIVRRTSRLSRCRVDVGFFGSESTAKLLLERIRDNLTGSASEAGKKVEAVAPHPGRLG